MAGTGASTQTQRALASDPDLDQSLYNQPVPPPALSNGLRNAAPPPVTAPVVIPPPSQPQKFYTPAGKTPAQIQAEQAAAAAAYQKYKDRPRKR